MNSVEIKRFDDFDERNEKVNEVFEAKEYEIDFEEYNKKNILIKIVFLYPILNFIAKHTIGRFLGFILTSERLQKFALSLFGRTGIDSSKSKEYKKYFLAKINNNKSLEVEEFFITTPSGARISSVEIRPKQINKQNVIYIINFEGVFSFFEKRLKGLSKESIEEKDPQIVNIAFNYPGINESKGRLICKEDLVNAGIAQVKRLIDKGVNPSQICVNGHSLGGAVSALVAEYFYEKYNHSRTKNTNEECCISHFNNKSFDSTIQFVPAHILEFFNKISKNIKKAEVKNIILNLPFKGLLIVPWLSVKAIGLLLAAVSYIILTPILIISAWHINAGKAYRKLPDKKKDFLAIVPLEETKKEDGIIPISDSIYKSEESVRKKQIEAIKKILFQLKKYDYLNSIPLNLEVSIMQAKIIENIKKLYGVFKQTKFETQVKKIIKDVISNKGTQKRPLELLQKMLLRLKDEIENGNKLDGSDRIGHNMPLSEMKVIGSTCSGNERYLAFVRSIHKNLHSDIEKVGYYNNIEITENHFSI